MIIKQARQPEIQNGSMKRSFFLITAVAIFLNVSAQTGIKISTPEVSYLNGILSIKYDIAGCGSNDFVNVRLVILDSKGDTLRPTYISGDLGSRVSCGFGKKIEWNMQRDGVLIDEEIEVLVTGRPVVQETPVYSMPVTEKGLTRGNVILSSVFVPGLGQAKATGKKGALVMSGLFYGLAGTSAFFYAQKVKYYNDYQSATGTLRDQLFEKSEKNFNNSRYALLGAAGIWAVNFVWSAAVPIRENGAGKTSVNIITVPGKGSLIAFRKAF
jgi:hypothetical protein